MTTRLRVEQKLEEYIKEAEAKSYMIQLLDSVMQKWEGKQITKRIMEHLKLYIPQGFRYSLHRNYAGMSLYFFRGSRVIYPVLCPRDNKKFSIEWFRNKNKDIYKFITDNEKLKTAYNDMDSWYGEFMDVRENTIKLREKMKLSGCETLFNWGDFTESEE